MEIGAATSSAYLPALLSGPRVVRSVSSENSTALERPTRSGGRDRVDDPTQQPILSSGTETQTSRQPQNIAGPQAAEALRSERQNTSDNKLDEARQSESPQVAIDPGGSIKMDVEDGDRVLRVFDSKDVLIYQLPPKGALMLIKAQEKAQQSQVQTSA